MEDVRCPMCGKPNPPDEEVCQFCQARLRPIEGFAFSDGDLYFDSSKEPGKELGRDVNTSIGPELPDWLKSFRQEDDVGIASEEEFAKEIARIANLSMALGYKLEDENRILTKEEAYQQIGHSASLFKAILEYVKEANESGK